MYQVKIRGVDDSVDCAIRRFAIARLRWIEDFPDLSVESAIQRFHDSARFTIRHDSRFAGFCSLPNERFHDLAWFLDYDESIWERFLRCLLPKQETWFMSMFVQWSGLMSAVKTLNMSLSSTLKKTSERYITCLPYKQPWDIGSVLIQCFPSNDFPINSQNRFNMFCEKPENCHISCELNVLSRNSVKKWYHDYCVNILHDFALRSVRKH